MRVILAGGGTGGHIYPALSIAEQIKKHHPDVKLLYIGSSNGLEANIVTKTKIPFEPIVISGFKRSISFQNIKTIYHFLKAVQKSRTLIRDFSPDIVIGTGGYVCGPVVYAAAKLQIPTLIHEQNIIPGLTNKFLARYASRIAVSFSGSAPYFPTNKVTVTGNPRATEVAKADPERGRSSLSIEASKRIVLIVGGSRGARAINDAFIGAIGPLSELENVHFVYVTGEVHFEHIKQRLEENESAVNHVSVHPYIHNMPEVLAATELIINRAGASFLAEITSLGIPSILIPSPYVTNNHQEKNARWLEEHGASVVLLEKDLTAAVLVSEIEKLMCNFNLIKEMRKAAVMLGEPLAAEKVYYEIKKMIKD